MNLLIKELKSRWLSNLLWIVGMGLFLIMAQVEFKAMQQAGPALDIFMDNFPPVMKAVFGFNEVNLTTEVGYMKVVVNYLLILLSIHGLFLGISILNNEKQQKTSDFLFSKPMSRSDIFDFKVFSGFIFVLIIDLILALVIMILGLNNGWNYFVVFISSHLFFYSLGLLLSTYLNDKASGIGLIIILILFILPIMVDLSGMDSVFKKLSVFSMFDYSKPMVEGIILLLLALVFRVVSKQIFVKKDILG